MAFTEEEARERKNARQREYSKKTNYASQKKYHKENSKIINFRVFLPKDNDIVEFLDQQQNKAGYLKELIRADMEKL